MKPVAETDLDLDLTHHLAKMILAKESEGTLQSTTRSCIFEFYTIIYNQNLQINFRTIKYLNGQEMLIWVKGPQQALGELLHWQPDDNLHYIGFRFTIRQQYLELRGNSPDLMLETLEDTLHRAMACKEGKNKTSRDACL